MKNKNVLKFFYSLIVLFCLNSCSNLNSYRPQYDNYTFRYNGEITNLDSLICIDGYYQSTIINKSYTTFMFYRDGTFALNLGVYNNSSFKPDSIVSIFAWGAYKICGDTIKTQSILRMGKFWITRLDMYERWFKIISKDTLLDIYYKNFLDPEDKRDYLNSKLYFTPAIRPDSSCWLKEQKWAWEKGEIKK